jgi:2-methylcitrate dehydratase PrpD
MGAVLGLIAVHGSAQLIEFEQQALTDPAVAEFREKVSMELDSEVDGAYPARWLGRVIVTTTDGRTLSAAIDEPKGDPGNTLSRPELEDKFQRLLAFSGARTVDQGKALIEQVWQLRDATSLNNLN